ARTWWPVPLLLAAVPLLVHEALPLLGRCVVGEDRLHRARRLTGLAVDALVGMDVVLVTSTTSIPTSASTARPVRRRARFRRSSPTTQRPRSGRASCTSNGTAASRRGTGHHVRA